MKKSSPGINIKLIQGLKLLSDKEYSLFCEFAGCRFFSGHRNYDSILAYLRPLHRNGFEGLDNSKFLNDMSCALKVSPRSLLNRISELYSVLENFLVNLHLEKDTFEKERILMKVFLDKEAFRLFDYLSAKTAKDRKHRKLDISELRRKHDAQYMQLLGAFYSRNFDLVRETANNLPLYECAGFLGQTLTYSMEHAQQRISGLNFDNRLVSEIIASVNIEALLDHFKKRNPLLHKFLRIMYLLHLCFEDLDDHASFKKARNLHSQIIDSISDSGNQDIYFAFINFCVNNISMGRENYEHILFGIIDEKLRSGYSNELKKDNFPVNNFRDYLLIALSVGEIAWAKEFVKTYVPLLPESSRADDELLARSRILQYEEKFGESLNYLNKVSNKNYLHYVDTITLKMRALFKLGYYLECFQDVERLRQYLRYHSEIPPAVKEEVKKFAGDLTILLRHKEGKISSSVLKQMFRKRSQGKVRKWIKDEVHNLCD